MAPATLWLSHISEWCYVSGTVVSPFVVLWLLYCLTRQPSCWEASWLTAPNCHVFQDLPQLRIAVHPSQGNRHWMTCLSHQRGMTLRSVSALELFTGWGFVMNALKPMPPSVQSCFLPSPNRCWSQELSLISFLHVNPISECVSWGTQSLAYLLCHLPHWNSET